jgi:hypothetical protein
VHPSTIDAPLAAEPGLQNGLWAALLQPGHVRPSPRFVEPPAEIRDHMGTTRGPRVYRASTNYNNVFPLISGEIDAFPQVSEDR